MYDLPSALNTVGEKYVRPGPLQARCARLWGRAGASEGGVILPSPSRCSMPDDLAGIRGEMRHAGNRGPVPFAGSRRKRCPRPGVSRDHLDRLVIDGEEMVGERDPRACAGGTAALAGLRQLGLGLGEGMGRSRSTGGGASGARLLRPGRRGMRQIPGNTRSYDGRVSMDTGASGAVVRGRSAR